MKNIVLSFALLLASLSISASAGNLNVGTLRGTVVDNTPDCYHLAAWIPTGAIDLHAAVSTRHHPPR